MKIELEQIYFDIKRDCFNMIKEKNVNVEDLAFDLGVTVDEFVELFKKRHDDFSFYLKAYELLVAWEG